MVERQGGQPEPEPSTSEPDNDEQSRRRVLRGAELERLRATHPDIRSPFALEWTDERGAHHLVYNHRRVTVDRNGNSRLHFYYGAPPTFETTYEDWRVGTAYESGRHGARPLGELYTMLLRRDELGRSGLDRFLTEADKAGYNVARWFSGRRDREGLRQGGAPAGASQDGTPVQAMTFLLQKRPDNANVGSRQG